MTIYERLREMRGHADANEIISRIDADELLEVIEAANELGRFVSTTPVNPQRLERLRTALVIIGAKTP